jgi:hypothetical protein
LRRVSRVRIEHLWLSLPIAFLVWFGFLRRVGMVDFWWHLKAGQIIVAAKSIPRVDLFSFTCPGRPFILQNWLVDVVYYGIYQTGGLPLLIALNTTLLVAALVPVYHLCYQATAGVRTAVLAAFMAVISLLSFSNIRSQVCSFVCFSAAYWVLSSYCRRSPSLAGKAASGLGSRDFLWALPPLMVVWVNLHGAFVLGLALGGMFVCCEAARRLVLGPQGDTLSTRQLRQLALVVVLAALATLVNPEGYRIYSSVSAVALDPVSQSFVTEWQDPRLDRLGIFVFYGPLLITLLVFLYARQRLNLTELVLFVGFAAFGLSAVRNAIWFVLICAPIVARHLPTFDAGSILQPLRRFQRINSLAGWMASRAESSAHAPVRYGLNTVIAAAMIAIAIVLSPWVRPHLHVQRLGTTLWDPRTPLGAVDYIQSHGLQGNIFNPEIYGDYLVWRLWPRQRSFVDSRVHLFQACPALVDDYNLVFYDAHWEERLARYDIRYVLLNKDGKETRTIINGARTSPQWQVLYEDELSILFEKRNLT